MNNINFNQLLIISFRYLLKGNAFILLITKYLIIVAYLYNYSNT